jgi:hypothetical protein
MSARRLQRVVRGTQSLTASPFHLVIVTGHVLTSLQAKFFDISPFFGAP